MQSFTHRITSAQTATLTGRLYLGVTLITGLLIAILIAVTPAGVDDLLFLLPAKGYKPGLQLFDMMTGEIPRIWDTQTGRLGNFVAMPFLYLFPKWVFGIITGVLTSLLILLSCKISRCSNGSIISWLIYATVIIAYPWYDSLTMVTYAVNYIWAATAAAGAVVCVMHMPGYNMVQKAGACFLMFVAGWMHEGFGVPLTAGLTVWIIFRHREIEKGQVVAWIFMGAGTFMTALSPTFWSRSGNSESLLAAYPYMELLMNIGPAIIFLTAMTFSVIWILLDSRLRKAILLSATAIILITAALASTAVYLKYYSGPRTAAPAILYSMLSCGYLLTGATDRNGNHKRLQLTAGLLTGGFGLLHLSYACISQTHLNREYAEAIRLYDASDDGVIYYDLTFPKPDLSLYKTTIRQLHERVPKEFIRIYHKPDHKMTILPKAMRSFTPDSATKSEMTRGAMIYNGWIVLPDTIDTEQLRRVHILTEDGRYISTRFRIDRFPCHGYGDFQLLTPHVKVLESSLAVKDVSLHDNAR